MGMGLQRHCGRATGILVAGALGVALLGSGGVSARADEPAPGQRSGTVKNSVVDVDIANVRLQDALRLIESKTGINYVLVNPQLQYNSVTLTLSGKPVDVVLHQMAIAAGADIWQEGNIY